MVACENTSYFLSLLRTEMPERAPEAPGENTESKTQKRRVLLFSAWLPLFLRYMYNIDPVSSWFEYNINRIWPKCRAGIGKTINILTGSGIWLPPGKRDSPLSYRALSSYWVQKAIYFLQKPYNTRKFKMPIDQGGGTPEGSILARYYGFNAN